MMVLDGVYTLKNNRPCFHRVNAPDRSHLDKLLNRIIARVTRRLVKDGLLIPDSEQPWLDLEETDVLDTLNAASTRYRVAIGPGADRRTLTLKNPALIRTATLPKPFTVDRDGFSLNAAVSCQPNQRNQLERLCRYVTRPALCLERLSIDSDGKVVYELKHPFRDGTTHILFTPTDFIARLAALVPRPRANLTRYHGVFAPNSPFRKFIVPGSPKRARRKCKTSTDSKPYESNPDSEQSNADPEPLTAPLSWAQRLKRVFEIDISVCPRCGGTLRVIADITDPDIIRTILDHLSQRAPPAAPPQRAPPSRSQDDLFAAS
jgi:hypothetical protein